MLDLMRNLIGGGHDARVDGATARKLVADGATLLDVRTPEEFAAGSVTQAKNIPVQVLAQRLDEVAKDQPVVVFCRSGGRSAKAAGMLQRAGYQAFDAGGIGNLQ